jgi:phosphohistidine phosphatase SixA
MKEIWILRHSHRRDYEPDWNKHPRYKENNFDTPLSKYGFELAKKGAYEIIKRSKALQNNNIKYIYCSPYTRCIQSAIEIIKEVKNKLNFDLKLIIVYDLGESGWWAKYDDYEFNGNKLNINKVLIDLKMKPTGIKKRFKNYITKIIGKTIKDVTYDKELETMTNAILNINNKEKNSYIIVGHLDTIRLGYKYFYQDKIKKKEPKWATGGEKYVNTIMGFSEKNKKFKMIYKPNYKF